MTATVDGLRKQGYKVRVSHVRQLRAPLIIAPTDYAEDGLDWKVTRYEYENGQKSMDIPWDKNILSTGGFTVVEIETPDGVKLKGKHGFNGKPYNRKIGRNAALGRALLNGGK